MPGATDDDDDESMKVRPREVATTCAPFPFHSTLTGRAPSFRQYGTSVSTSAPEIRQAFIRKVYSILAIQLLFTAACSVGMVQPAVIDWTRTHGWFFWIPIVGSFASLFTLFVSLSPFPAHSVLADARSGLTIRFPLLSSGWPRRTRSSPHPALTSSPVSHPQFHSRSTLRPHRLTLPSALLHCGDRYPLNLIVLGIFTLFEGMAVGTVVSFYESRVVIQGASTLRRRPRLSSLFHTRLFPLDSVSCLSCSHSSQDKIGSR